MAFLCLGLTGAYGQDRTCGTEEKLAQMKLKYPEVETRMAAIEQETQEWQETNGQIRVATQSYPQIPGFEPSGDPEIDARNFNEAKTQLISTDPELYNRLTTSIQAQPPRKPARK